MSINNSYFNKNNTIFLNSFVNAGQEPIAELVYGLENLNEPRYTYSRFIFDINLDLLKSKINDGLIQTGCTSSMTHTLIITNTATFEKDLINQKRFFDYLTRATSFDLFLFRIPLSSGDTGDPQTWDEGIGKNINLETQVDLNLLDNDLSNYSINPSNWFARKTTYSWSNPGIYDNSNSLTAQTGLNYSALTIIDHQHFEFGNENISFDMTDEINGILNGTITGVTGWGIAYTPNIENFTATTNYYSVEFFTRHTQTFYEPYLLTSYDDLIEDDRDLFALGKANKLYLYAYDDGNPVNLDSNPYVTIFDSSGDPISGLTSLNTCRKTKGVYEVTIPALLGYKTPCTFTDVWSGITLNGVSLPNIENELIVRPYSSSITIGTSTNDPSVYGFDYYGIKQDEKILNTDIRKVGVIIKKEYTSNQPLNKINAYYRVYVKEGQTEVQVQDWTKINKTPNEYYFIFDTRDKIPNEYFIDIKLNINGEVNTYKRQIKFQIVNKK
jgi:hypothetical protein